MSSKPTSGHDSKYFSTTKKGEIHELREELRSQSKDKKKDAVKKVIAAMTVGKDVSMLFTDVVNCMQTPNLELKKLVYLYLMNYAKNQPDLAIMAVNTFVKDAADPKPLVRALAVRTMGCIRVDKITEYLCEPLRKCLKDEDPYVRKTAAVCVAKLHDINPELAEDRGFIEDLINLLSDANPMVVANAVSALTEIAETSPSADLFKANSSSMSKLLAALNECTEWGQVFILDALALHDPTDAREAESIAERVTPRLQHANSAVVLSACKVLLKYMDSISNVEVVRSLCKKMAPPLVTLMSGVEPEIQYVALRNIDLVVQKRSNILSHEIKIFFCKYNDPIYVKLEKLEIMIKLASDRNIDQVLMEFKEYATEVDVDFVRKAVRAIGRCAIKLEKAAERCVNVLLELIQTKVNYVVQEAIVVIKDIFRRYPNRYESIIGTLCENLDTLDEPEAKAAMVWIIGEYAERIENADELLELFLDTFSEETTQVQLQLLTATVKLFLKKPKDAQEMVQSVLNLATQESDNPDLRDRGYVYWRLLSTDPEAAKAVVLAEKPLISDDTNVLDPTLLDELVRHIGSLASVYHKPPEAFVSKLRTAVTKARPIAVPTMDDDEPAAAAASPSAAPPAGVGDLLDLGDVVGSPAAAPAAAAAPAPAAASAMDLLSGGGGAGSSGGTGLEMLSDPFAAPTPAAAAPLAAAAAAPKTPYLAADKGQGMVLSGAFARRGGQMFLDLTIENQGATPLSGFALQFNKNFLGLAPAAGVNLTAPVMPGQKVDTSVALASANPPAPSNGMVQMAIKNNVSVFYFQDSVPMASGLLENGRLEKNEFLQQWKAIPDSNERITTLSDIPTNLAGMQQKFEARNVFFIHSRPNGNENIVYLSAKSVTQAPILLELTFTQNSTNVKCAIRTSGPELAPAMEVAVGLILRS